MEKNGYGIITIFDSQPLQNVHLVKDVGLLPGIVAEKTGCDGLIIAIKGEERTPSSITIKSRKLNICNVPNRFGRGKCAGSILYALNAFGVARVLAAEAYKSRILLVFHAHPAFLIYAIIYKIKNPKGKIWLKLDMEDGGVDHFLKKRNRFRLYLRFANIVSAESSIIQKRLNREFGRIRHIECIPNGYDSIHYPIDENSFTASRGNTFLTVGRLGSWQKNSECFLDAIANSGLRNCEFRFIGKSTDVFKKKAMEAIRSSGQNIRLLGYFDSRESIFCQYDEAKAFVLSSRYEGFALVLVEAIAHGCFIISTDLSCARELIGNDENVGLIVPQDDPEALAAALRRVASMEIDHRAIAQTARRFYYENVVATLPWIEIIAQGAKTLEKHMAKPQISVALASYNGEHYIAEQLDSILGQDCAEDFEIVVSDDHSSDSTLSILREYEERYPGKLRVLESERNEGLRKNFEKAIRACEGDFIALADQDDWWRPDKLRILSRLLRGGALLAFNDMELADESLRDIGRSMWQSIGLGLFARRAIASGRGYKLFLRENKIAGCSLMARRDFLLSCLPFPEFYLHDEWIALLASFLGRIAPCRERLSLYRQHAAQEVGAGGRGLSEAASFVPDAAYLAAASAGREELVRRLAAFGAEQRRLAFAEKWIAGRSLAEEQRYLSFSPGAVLALLRDGSYFRYLSGFKALAKDIFRLVRRQK